MFEDDAGITQEEYKMLCDELDEQRDPIIMIRWNIKASTVKSHIIHLN